MNVKVASSFEVSSQSQGIRFYESVINETCNQISSELTKMKEKIDSASSEWDVSHRCLTQFLLMTQRSKGESGISQNGRNDCLVKYAESLNQFSKDISEKFCRLQRLYLEKRSKDCKQVVELANKTRSQEFGQLKQTESYYEEEQSNINTNAKIVRQQLKEIQLNFFNSEVNDTVQFMIWNFWYEVRKSQLDCVKLTEKIGQKLAKREVVKEETQQLDPLINLSKSVSELFYKSAEQSIRLYEIRSDGQFHERKAMIELSLKTFQLQRSGFYQVFINETCDRMISEFAKIKEKKDMASFEWHSRHRKLTQFNRMIQQSKQSTNKRESLSMQNRYDDLVNLVKHAESVNQYSLDIAKKFCRLQTLYLEKRSNNCKKVVELAKKTELQEFDLLNQREQHPEEEQDQIAIITTIVHKQLIEIQSNLFNRKENEPVEAKITKFWHEVSRLHCDFVKLTENINQKITKGEDVNTETQQLEHLIKLSEYNSNLFYKSAEQSIKDSKFQINDHTAIYFLN